MQIRPRPTVESLLTCSRLVVHYVHEVCMRRFPVSTGVRFSEVEIVCLQTIAEREDRTVSNVIRLLVREALARREEREPERPEA